MTKKQLSTFCRELTRRVSKGEDCWAWQVQSLAHNITNSVSNTNNEAAILMRACQRDIVDLCPSEQKLLTEIAWDCVTSCDVSQGRSLEVHNNMILAHTFQGIRLNSQTVQERMRADNLEPDMKSHHSLLDNLSKLSPRGIIQSVHSLV